MRVKTTKDLGNLVHDRRKALGMTQAELAVRVGVSRLWVNQVESGHGGAAVAKVLQLLSALGMTVNLDLAVPRPQVSGGAATRMAMPKARPVNAKGR